MSHKATENPKLQKINRVLKTSVDEKQPRASRNAIRVQCLKKLESVERRLDALAKKLASDSK